MKQLATQYTNLPHADHAAHATSLVEYALMCTMALTDPTALLMALDAGGSRRVAYMAVAMAPKSPLAFVATIASPLRSRFVDFIRDTDKNLRLFASTAPGAYAIAFLCHYLYAPDDGPIDPAEMLRHLCYAMSILCHFEPAERPWQLLQGMIRPPADVLYASDPNSARGWHEDLAIRLRDFTLRSDVSPMARVLAAINMLLVLRLTQNSCRAVAQMPFDDPAIPRAGFLAPVEDEMLPVVSSRALSPHFISGFFDDMRKWGVLAPTPQFVLAYHNGGPSLSPQLYRSTDELVRFRVVPLPPVLTIGNTSFLVPHRIPGIDSTIDYVSTEFDRLPAHLYEVLVRPFIVLTRNTHVRSPRVVFYDNSIFVERIGPPRVSIHEFVENPFPPESPLHTVLEWLFAEMAKCGGRLPVVIYHLDVQQDGMDWGMYFSPTANTYWIPGPSRQAQQEAIEWARGVYHDNKDL